MKNTHILHSSKKKLAQDDDRTSVSHVSPLAAWYHMRWRGEADGCGAVVVQWWQLQKQRL